MFFWVFLPEVEDKTRGVIESCVMFVEVVVVMNMGIGGILGYLCRFLAILSRAASGFVVDVAAGGGLFPSFAC